MKYKARSTNDMISESFPVSLTLGIEAMLIAVGLGVLIGVISSLYHNRFPDYLATTIAVLRYFCTIFYFCRIDAVFLSV